MRCGDRYDVDQNVLRTFINETWKPRVSAAWSHLECRSVQEHNTLEVAVPKIIRSSSNVQCVYVQEHMTHWSLEVAVGGKGRERLHTQQYWNWTYLWECVHVFFPFSGWRCLVQPKLFSWSTHFTMVTLKK